MNYVRELKRALDESKPLGRGYNREELIRRIEMISAELKRPLGDAERIMLCADREALRKTLSEMR